MELGAVGPESASANLAHVTSGVPLAAPAATALSAASAGTVGDSVATLLSGSLSAPDIARLIGWIERPPPAQSAAQLENLLQAFVSAAAEGDAIRAVSALSEIAELDPSRPDILRADPALAAIRVSVDQFLDRHTMLTRIDAEGRLEQAAQSAGPSAPEKLPGWDMRPATMLDLANRIFESGGLANYVRAAEMAQLVIDGSRWAPEFAGFPLGPPDSGRIGRKGAVTRPHGMAGQAIRRMSGMALARLIILWKRAPLLILLLSWLLLGIAGGSWSLLWQRFRLETWPGALVALAFEVWGTGFLVLVGFGFYAQLRKARF